MNLEQLIKQLKILRNIHGPGVIVLNEDGQKIRLLEIKKLDITANLKADCVVLKWT